MAKDGFEIGEARLNALLCGHYGVPVAFVSGDTAACGEARAVLGEDLPTYAVKDGIDMFTASCLHPEVTQKGIRDGVKQALKALSGARRPPYRGKAPYRFGFEWNTTTIASTCALIPTVRKVNPRTTEFSSDDLPAVRKTPVDVDAFQHLLEREFRVGAFPHPLLHPAH